MADLYASEFVGVADGTKATPDKADGRLVGYRPRGIVATKAVGVTIASGDRFYIGRKRKGETIRRIEVVADASLGSATIAIGDGTTAEKYAAAATMTVANIPQTIGPKAVAAAESADGDFEDIWATIAAASIASARTVQFQIEIAGLN